MENGQILCNNLYETNGIVANLLTHACGNP